MPVSKSKRSSEPELSVTVVYEGSTYKFPDPGLRKPTTILHYECDGERRFQLLPSDLDEGLTLLAALHKGKKDAFNALLVAESLDAFDDFTATLGWCFKRHRPQIYLTEILYKANQ